MRSPIDSLHRASIPRPRRLALALAVGLLVATSVTGSLPAAPPDELAETVGKLIRQLNDDQLKAREDAEKKLAELGPAVLKSLPAVTDRTPAEVKHRLARVRQKLEQAQAEAATQQSTVTIKKESVPLTDVLAEIEQQTGNPLQIRDAGGQEPARLQVTVGFDKTPFWPAVDQLLDQAGMTIYPFSQEQTLPLVVAVDGQPPRYGRAQYVGPFRMEAVRVEAHRPLRNPANESMKLHVEVAWEPRLKPISLKQSLSDLMAVGSQGGPLAVSNDQAEVNVAVHPGAMAVELEIPFVLPPRNVAEITQLDGTLYALVPGTAETFRFDDIAQAAKSEKRQASVTVSIDSVRKNNDVWEIRMRVGFDQASGALESHRGWIYSNDCYLEGEGNKRIEHAGLETTRQTETEVGIAYLFALPDGPEGLSFVYKTPAALMSLPVRYQLKNIPLP